MSSTPPSSPLDKLGAVSQSELLPEVLTLLESQFSGKVLSVCVNLGDWEASVAKGSVPEIMRFLRDDKRTDFKMLADLSAVDGLKMGLVPRFYVVYHLYSIKLKHRLRVKTNVSEEDPAVPSLVDVWPIANWFEREVWDMFGIRFTGHPDLKRILMYEGFQGHPLRKDYPVNYRQPLIGPRN
ncbi:MAG: NADH-quinone oxidoreductase subunit C [Candidatus Omnitrophica bacterium]|nr:NADH-quinone oxidoreductase subunit C [Candidatus Omnitrophota bacterium]